MQSTDVDNQHQDTASLVPEWPSAMEDRSHGPGRPSPERQAIHCQANAPLYSPLFHCCFDWCWRYACVAILWGQGKGDAEHSVSVVRLVIGLNDDIRVSMASIQHKMKFRPRRRFLRQRHPPLPLQLLLISRSLSLWLAISPQCGAA